MIKRILLGLLFGVILLAAITSYVVTRDGSQITPEGDGNITLEAGTFESFPLPDYAANAVTPDYKSYFVEVEPGIKLHILEVGEGYPVYAQHGNPTSGFLYRKVAAELPLEKVRIIMPTMVGLGFSSKVPASEHTLDNHIRWMNSALSQLNLEGVVYVGQDWGGPIGMGALSRSPALIEGAVIMNTGLIAPTEKRDLSSAHARVKTPIVGELLLETFIDIFPRLKDAQGDPESISEVVADLYGNPVRDSGNAKAPLALMRMVPDSPDHPSADLMSGVETYSKSLDVPIEIVWGTKDPILGPTLPAMIGLFPDASVTETNAGHFLQEEVPEEIAAAIMRVVDEVDARKLPAETLDEANIVESLVESEETPVEEE